MQGVGAVVGVLTGAEQLPPKQQALPSPHSCCFRTLPHLSCSPRLFAPSACLPTPGRPVSRRRRRGASGPPRCTPASPSRQSSSRSTRTRPARRCSGTWTASLRASSPGARRDTSESFPSHLLDASWTPPRKLARRATASQPTPHLGHPTATARRSRAGPATPPSPRREQRSYLLAHRHSYRPGGGGADGGADGAEGGEGGEGLLEVEGYVRGLDLSAERLLHVTRLLRSGAAADGAGGELWLRCRCPGSAISPSSRRP